jgi:hypothetical protein
MAAVPMPPTAQIAAGEVGDRGAGRGEGTHIRELTLNRFEGIMDGAI